MKQKLKREEKVMDNLFWDSNISYDIKKSENLHFEKFWDIMKLCSKDYYVDADFGTVFNENMHVF